MSGEMQVNILPDGDLVLGISLPPLTPHAISVSLPAWQDNVGYVEGETRVLKAMDTGYPRFFVHRSIRKLADVCLAHFGRDQETCMLFPSERCAEACYQFIVARSLLEGSPVQARHAVLDITGAAGSHPNLSHSDVAPPASQVADVKVYVVIFPATAVKVAKQFWQHTGLGISSRRAEYYLSILAQNSPQQALASTSSSLVPWDIPDSFIRHFDPSPTVQSKNSISGGKLDYLGYSVKHFEDVSPLESASSAKSVMRARIAALSSCEGVQESIDPKAVAFVTEDDVYLFPSGMVAIWNIHQLVLSLQAGAKTVCFGFPYTDTLKVLEKWGNQCYFMAKGDPDELETFLREKASLDPSSPPITALFTEFPSNPLLRSPDLERLRNLADKYNFMVIVDATIGNLVNVEVLQYVDVVVHSLSKVFSGYTNVMGGSLVINPRSRTYNVIKSWLSSNYEDTWFDQDAIMMERNSRDLESRIRRIDDTAETLCDFMHSRSLAGGANPANAVVRDIFYPKYVTRENYDRCRRRGNGKTAGGDAAPPGFGCLFTITFTKPAASHAFYHALECYKGASLGTNFTLASPYTILAHYAEKEWAAAHGVEEHLVRISVGLEDKMALLATFEKALDAAERLK